MSGMQNTKTYHRIKAVWRRGQILLFFEGSLAFMRWFLPLGLAVGIVDWLVFRWLFDTPVAVRIVTIFLALGWSLYKAWRMGWGKLRPFDAIHTALRIERQKGGMNSLLVSALHFSDVDNHRDDTSSALCELACRHAEATIDEVDPNEMVRFQGLRFPISIAVFVMLIAGFVATTHGPLFQAGLVRLFAPWRSQDYPTRTQLSLENRDLVVQEGQPARIAARVGGVIPQKAKVAIRTGSSKPRIRSVRIENGTCEYQMETTYRDFDYRIMVGDARSDWGTVQVIPAPNIKHATVTLAFPDYTKKPDEMIESLTMTVPETTTVKWQLSLDRAVREATMTLAGESPIPLTISEDGLTATAERMALGSRAYRFAWVEQEHGFAFESPTYYLQVSPDRPPRAELTSPPHNIYATLGRKLELGFRGSDDHGVAASFVCYQVDKTEEQKIRFNPVRPLDGTDQLIDWDYRSVLTNLVVGQTVTFAVELIDAYPGEKGPHLARTESRRMQFLSMEDYLRQVERQKKRMLSRLRTSYKEERNVHAAVLRLDRSDPTFVQSCQLEAVRQDLMREDLHKLHDQFFLLIEDLDANGVSNAVLIESLETLRQDVIEISSNHLAKSAAALRSLAGVADVEIAGAHTHAVHMINDAARELGLLVLQLGFEDAADVMGREMHAAAETQAALRLRTITPGGDVDALASDQERLGTWLTRLFAASPKQRESTITDALIEFTLTRIVKQMMNAGIDQDLANAAALIRKGEIASAAKIQTGMIASMLKGEFRLRVGAERETLARAMDLFRSQAKSQEALRDEIESLDETDFEKKQISLVDVQSSLHRKLQLLLMPAVPAPRPKLFDVEVPTEPPVAEMLGAADSAMSDASRFIGNGDREAALDALQRSEQLFVTLADITRQRIASMTQAVRILRRAYASKETNETMGRLVERQFSILEKTEDAAADELDSDYLAGQQAALADALEELKVETEEHISRAASPHEYALALPARLNDALQAMRTAVPILTRNQPDEAAEHQLMAVSGIEAAQEILAEHSDSISAFASMLAMTKLAEKPSPYVSEIVEEQQDLYEITQKLKPDDMPQFEIPQKNLIHAVDAILAALDPIAHLVESGTVMMFAKEDMDAAGEALAIKDDFEALDAQDYIIETLENLRVKVDVVVPKFQYLLEISESLYEAFQESTLIREAQYSLRQSVLRENPDIASIVARQQALKTRTTEYADLMHTITGLDLYAETILHMTKAVTALQNDNIVESSAEMMMAETALKSEVTTVLALMKHISLVLAAPQPDVDVATEIIFLQEMLGVAADQKALYREVYAAESDMIAGYETKLRKLSNVCEPLITQAKQHKAPSSIVTENNSVEVREQPAGLQRKLVKAKERLDAAVEDIKNNNYASSLQNQDVASETLRHFVVEYAMLFAAIPPPAPPADPAPTEDFSETEDMLMLFMPGAVSGKRPPDGRLEWEVLGKRDRAALNENFARELPLEYRAILKDYYERLAR